MFVPAIVYSIKAFITSGVLQHKFVLSSMIVVVIIMTLVSLLNKYTPRCTVWLILTALWACLDSVGSVILVFTITQAADEFIASPVKRYAKRVYLTRKEFIKT